MNDTILEVRSATMSAEEARNLVQRIQRQMADTRTLILSLKEREGWRALGYASWNECVTKEFNLTPLFYLEEIEDLSPEEIMAALDKTDQAEEAPEAAPTAAETLASLPPEEQVAAIKEGQGEIAKDKERLDLEDAVERICHAATRMRRAFHGPLKAVCDKAEPLVNQLVEIARSVVDKGLWEGESDADEK
jgi:hypothetical protein